MVKLKEYYEGRTPFFSADLDHYSENKTQPKASLPIFYNPRMVVNRDLSVLFLSTYNQMYPIKNFCEPLASSGVRTLRYLNEGIGDYEGLMFDINPEASKIAKQNIEHNNLQHRAKVLTGDAKLLLLSESRGKRFDYVDVDPFGSPAVFINAAIQSLVPKNGLLAVTATDMPVLCGVFPRVALRKYGGISIKAPFLHEIAIRLLIGLIYHVAGMNDRAINPLISLSTDHYVRLWLKVDAERKTTNKQANQIGFIYYCPKCMSGWKVSLLNSKSLHSRCDRCEGKGRVAGPLWIGNLYDKRILSNACELYRENDFVFEKRAIRILELMIEEHNLTDNLYVDIHELCDLHDNRPPKTGDIIEALRNNGYDVSRTHFRPTAIRTNADIEYIAKTIEHINRASE